MTSFGLWPLSKGYSKEYRDDFDPRITNEFATAAFRSDFEDFFINFSWILYEIPWSHYFRFGHSLIPKHFNRIRRTR